MYSSIKAIGVAIAGGSLIRQIIFGLFVGVIIALISPELGEALDPLGQLFIRALKSVAPIMVFVLVIASISQHQIGTKTNIKTILQLYAIGSFSAAIVAVVASMLFPTVLLLQGVDSVLSDSAPRSILVVLSNLLYSAVSNPVDALMNANYIGILTWSVLLGLALRHANDSTKIMVDELSRAVFSIVRIVIRLAPIGVMGLVSFSVATTGSEGLKTFAHLLVVLLGVMLFVALVVNPLIVFWKTRSNPYPLVLTCLRESGVTAFFTRSSAANIPVNLQLCEKLGLDKDTYSVSIPVGCTINMAGAAVTIVVLSMAAVQTLGIEVDPLSALLLAVMGTLGACGASGVPGGSLLLIPLACSVFGISDDISMQVVGVGAIIAVLQDSTETALNSSTDVVFTAAADISAKRVAGNCTETT